MSINYLGNFAKPSIFAGLCTSPQKPDHENIFTLDPAEPDEQSYELHGYNKSSTSLTDKLVCGGHGASGVHAFSPGSSVITRRILISPRMEPDLDVKCYEINSV